MEFISNKININTASINELVLLPGIGKKTAQKIVKYRKINGKFRLPKDLQNVNGIGEKKFGKIKKLLIIE